jgi:hypothetical protein
MADEITFIVEKAAEGGYVARAFGVSIFTEADDLDEIDAQVRDAVACHFDAEVRPGVIHSLLAPAT